MATVKVSFKVAMDSEQSKAKNHHTVELEVEMDVPSDVIEKYALKAFVVELQNQIRPNWGKFIKGEYPKSLDFGHSLFGKAPRKAEVTESDVKVYIAKQTEGMSQDAKVTWLMENGYL